MSYSRWCCSQPCSKHCAEECVCFALKSHHLYLNMASNHANHASDMMQRVAHEFTDIDVRSNSMLTFLDVCNPYTGLPLVPSVLCFAIWARDVCELNGCLVQI